jgi:hypothetical protein
VHLLTEISKDQLDTIIEKNCSKTVDPVVIVTDCGWSHRGWNANEAVVVCFDASNGCLLGMEIICRKLKADDLGNFEGASSQMEAEGILKILYIINSCRA